MIFSNSCLENVIYSLAHLLTMMKKFQIKKRIKLLINLFIEHE